MCLAMCARACVCVHACVRREAIFCASLNVQLPLPTHAPPPPLRRSRPQPLVRQPLRLPCFDRCSLCPNASRRTLWRLSHSPHTPSRFSSSTPPLSVPSIFHTSPSLFQGFSFCRHRRRLRTRPPVPEHMTKFKIFPQTFYLRFRCSVRQRHRADAVPRGPDASELCGFSSFGPTCGPP